MSKTLFILLNILLSLALLVNINLLHNLAIGLILGWIFILSYGYYLGRLIFAQKNTSWQLLWGILILLSAYSIIGAIIYYFYQLNQYVISLLIIISFALILFQKLDFKINFKWPKIKLRNYLLCLTYLFLTAILFKILLENQTTQAIHSPWEIIPQYFFSIYFLASLNLILLIFKNKNWLTNIFLAIHFFLTTSVALIIYRLGFGFDPFIHQTTEQIIFEQGFILPKPFYYLGQYSLVVFLSHLWQISSAFIDKILLPILMAIYLPYTLYQSLHLSFKWPKYICRLLSLSFLLLPFTLFIVTTPQALANILILIIIFLSFLNYHKITPLTPLAIITLATLVIHPISGIPAVIYLILFKLITTKQHKALIILISLAASIALPLSLYINSLISIYKINFNWGFNFNFWNIPWPQHFFFLDLVYLYQNLIYIIFVLIGLASFIYLYKNKELKIWLSSLLLFLILMINSLLLNFIEVSSIINYEQAEFACRVIQLAYYFLLAPFSYCFYLLLRKINKQNFIYRSFIILLVTASLSFSIYLSYPRYDDYQNSKFINLSEADLKTVEFIESISSDNYVVLANQMTSVAALQKFGFTKYYNQQYFYPLPTGGTLYQYYIKMLYQDTSKQTMIEAMEFTGVNTAYLILPHYLDNYPKIKELADQEAAAAYTIADRLDVFEYKQ